MKRKTVFKILGGVAVAIVGLVALVFYATSGVTRAADDFFEQARAGDIEALHAATSAEFQNVTGVPQLEYFIAKNRFDQVAETSWGSRSIKNNTGLVEGTVTLDDGGVIPLSIRLVSERGEWRISGIELSDAGLSGANATAPGANLPPENEVLSMAKLHTGILLGSLGSRDFEYLKEFWVDGTPLSEIEKLGELPEAFTPAVADSAVEALRDARPVLTGIVPQGAGFVANGYLTGGPWRYDFEYVYLPEGDGWKIAAMEYALNSS